MKNFILGLIIVLNGNAHALKGRWFDVQSNMNAGQLYFITLCQDGIMHLNCEDFQIGGHDAYIRSNNGSANTVGIKSLYPMEEQNCIPYSNGYCLFRAIDNAYYHIHLKVIKK